MHNQVAWQSTIVSQFFDGYNWTGSLESNVNSVRKSRVLNWYRQTVQDFLGGMYGVENSMLPAFDSSTHQHQRIISVKEYFDIFPW